MSGKRVEALISLENIAHNYKYLRSLVGDGCRVAAVVKADAYGHGAPEVCRLLSSLGADFFAVACTEEAAALRKGGINGSILVLGITPEEQYADMALNDVIQTVASAGYARSLAAHGKVRVHVKVDTGMSRLGIYCHSDGDICAAADEIERIYTTENVSLEGIFTHFAESDEPGSDFTRRQFEVFARLLGELERRRVDCGIRHCCNSAGILNFPEMHLDMVRAGIALYGYDPSPDTRDENLKPAMTLVSRVAFVSELRRGDTVSYGRTYTADRSCRAAVISIGYADGLMRALSGRWSLMINGKRAPLLGRICMDLCIADVTDIPCAPGDEAVVFGPANTVDDMAARLGTINYELLCSVKNRVPRRYI